MPEAVVVASSRTPLAKSFRGSFNLTRSDEMAAHCVRHVLDKVPQLDPALLGDVIFGCGFPEGTRWMVFKVKQRANYDYFEQIRKSSLAAGYTELVKEKGAFVNPTYSYNWPYDYFSLVELAEIASLRVSRLLMELEYGGYQKTFSVRLLRLGDRYHVRYPGL